MGLQIAKDMQCTVHATVKRCSAFILLVQRPVCQLYCLSASCMVSAAVTIQTDPLCRATNLHSAQTLCTQCSRDWKVN